jgi:3',5'-cyclic AMP phosphodiesterase CpdA
MHIVQITDLHVVAKDRLCYRKVPTNEQLRQAITHINDLRPSPDVVVASGDLTDHGREDEYHQLREIFSPLKFPVYVIPGNHDNRAILTEVFADQSYMPPPGSPFVNYAIDDHPIRLIGLDTSVPGHNHGEMCAARLQWLDLTLQGRPDTPTLIFMHHPPFRTGIRWMDSSGLHGGREMEKVVSRHRQVVRVACGHIHRPIHVAWAGTVASTSPSTCHQVALDLGGNDGFEFVMEPRAIQLHVWDPGYGLVSHLSYIPNSYEPIALLSSLNIAERGKIIAQSRRDYDALCKSEFDRKL